MNRSYARHVEFSLRWIARLCGLAVFGIIATIVIAHGVMGQLPNPFTQPPLVNLQLLLILSMTVGLVVAWRWELIGALAVLIPCIAFNVMALIFQGRLAGGATSLFVAAAALYLAHFALRRRLDLLSSPQPSA